MPSALIATCRTLAILSVVAILIGMSPARAQEPAASASEAAPAAEAILTEAEELLAEGAVEDDALIDLRLRLDETRLAVTRSADDVQARLDEIDLRLTEMGDAVEGESAETRLERERFAAERADLVVARVASEALETRIAEATAALIERRRRLFTDTLFARRDLGVLLDAGTYASAARQAEAVADLAADWGGTHWRERPAVLLIAALLILASALSATVLTMRLRPRLSPRLPAGAVPTYLGRVSRAFGLIVLRTLGILLLVALTYAALEALGLLTVRVRPLLLAALGLLAGTQFAIAVVQATLSPGRREWRLLDVSDHAAQRLAWLASLVVVVFAVDIFLDRTARVIPSSLDVTVAQNVLAAVIVGALLIAMAMVHPGRGDSAQAHGPARRAQRWSAVFRWGLAALGLALILSALFGYVALAQFMTLQIVVTGAILATMWIGFLTARAVSSEGALQASFIGRRLSGTRALHEERFDQIGVALSLLIGLLILLGGIPLVLLQWGFRAEEVGSWVLASVRGFRIGSVTISLTSLALAVLVFVLGLLATRALQRWLDSAVLERGRVDSGVRNSIRTIIGYVGLVIVALFSLSIAGVNFASLAFVAGALSVGIGFGLQNVVGNFVSGLILLAERPFRVGDIVETGTTLGTIKKISVRSTVIETFTRQSVIVPNSDLINGVVSNWTLGDRNARADIPVGVSYSADPRRVEAILYEIAAGHPLVMTDPAPLVVFNGFGASSLDFELRIYLANVSDKIVTSNELSYRIFERLKAESIEIPFPQRDVNVRTPIEVWGAS